jgi:hypothetical protein
VYIINRRLYLRLDDIQHVVLVIYNFFEIDDMHAFGVIEFGSTFVKQAPPRKTSPEKGEVFQLNPPSSE